MAGKIRLGFQAVLFCQINPDFSLFLTFLFVQLELRLGHLGMVSNRFWVIYSPKPTIFTKFQGGGVRIPCSQKCAGKWIVTATELMILARNVNLANGWPAIVKYVRRKILQFHIFIGQKGTSWSYCCFSSRNNYQEN